MRRITTIEYSSSQGQQGEQGPPGEGATFPIDSSNILYAPTGETAEEVFDRLLFVDLEIESFTTPQTVFEIGQVISALTFTWGLNKQPTAQTITGTSVAPPTLVPTERSKTVAFSSLSSNGTVTLTITDGANPPVTASINLAFKRGIFTGSAPIPGGGVDSAFVNTLSKALQTARQKTFTVNLTTGVYAWVAVPVSYGIPTFKLNGFNGGMEPVITVSVTNGYFYTENYYVSRSTNPSIGITTIEIL